MRCMICGCAMHPYFRKLFGAYGLGEVDYWQCGSCGFVGSKTHFDLPEAAWKSLNRDYHSDHQGTASCADDPNWVHRLQEQAAVILDLATLGLVPAGAPWLDYGCGDGKLSDFVGARGSERLSKFDRHMATEGYLAESDLQPGRFGLVVTTSVMEHIIRRDQIDEIAALVSRDGVMVVHTLVAEVVPRDPAWFYLLPVHSAFFTNRSMQCLFEQLGYRASIYHLESRLWFWFKTGADRVEKTVRRANASPGREGLHYYFKRGFMDYWKLDEQQVMQRCGAIGGGS